MTDEDASDPKSTRKARGVPIPLGGWWYLEIEKAFGLLSHEAIAKMVNNAAVTTKEYAGERWVGKEIARMRRHETDPTLPLIRAISIAFPVVPNPVFIAESLEEAQRFHEVQLEERSKRARESKRHEIEATDIKDRLAASLADALGQEGIDATNAAAATSKKKQQRRVLRDKRDRAKKPKTGA